jgi:hypothetical protein
MIAPRVALTMSATVPTPRWIFKRGSNQSPTNAPTMSTFGAHSIASAAKKYSYSNTLGIGNRTGTITVTTSGGSSSGTVANLVDGTTSSNPFFSGGRSRLEHGRLFGKRIDALPFFGGGFLDDDEFRKARHKKNARLLEFFVTHAHHIFSMTAFTSFLPSSVLSDLLSQLRFRHLRWHVVS